MKKNIAIVVLVVVVVFVLPGIFFNIGYKTAIADAEPYIENGKKYISFDDKIHEYGDVTKMIVYGIIADEINSVDGETYWQFKSDDDSTWWLLSVEDLGHVPEISERYVLIYDNMGTTYCPHEDCECYKYDDELLEIHKV